MKLLDYIDPFSSPVSRYYYFTDVPTATKARRGRFCPRRERRSATFVRTEGDGSLARPS